MGEHDEEGERWWRWCCIRIVPSPPAHTDDWPGHVRIRFYMLAFVALGGADIEAGPVRARRWRYMLCYIGGRSHVVVVGGCRWLSVVDGGCRWWTGAGGRGRLT